MNTILISSQHEHIDAFPPERISQPETETLACLTSDEFVPDDYDTADHQDLHFFGTGVNRSGVQALCRKQV